MPVRSSRGRSRLYRIYRHAYLKMVRQNHAPERIGRGAALGIFIGVFPTLYLGPVLSVAAAGLLRANRAAALVGNVVCGPLTPVTWTLAVVTGNWLAGWVGRDDWRIARELWSLESRAEIAQRFLGTFMAGNVAVSIGLAAAGYVLAWWLARRHQRAQRARAEARAAAQILTSDF